MKVQSIYRGLCWVCFVWIALQVFNNQPSRHSSSSSSSSDRSFSSTRWKTTDTANSSSSSEASSSPAPRLVEWLLQHNALVNVDVAYAGPGRGHVVLAHANMTRGDVLAAIPTDLCWVFEQHGAPSNNIELAAANLLAEMSDPGAFWQPFFDTLPPPNELVCPLVSMPQDYLPLLQSEPLETYVRAYQARVDGFWRDVVHPNEPGITLEMYRYARSVLITRMFGTALHGNVLVPLMHFANHANDCPNFYTERPCPHDPTRYCMVWMAGTFLAPGTEVCNSYKYMPNDKAMLQYGFLQDGPISEHLHLVDLPGFNGYNVWSLHEGSKHGPPLFNGTTAELQQEAGRLSATLTALDSADTRAASTQVAPSDVGGYLLGVMRTWRQQRKAVLQREVERLRQQAGAAAAAPDAAGGGAAAAAGAGGGRAALLECVRQHGGLVGSVTVGATHNASGGTTAAQQQALQHVIKPGLYATADVQAGSLLAAVPLALTVPLRPDKLKMDVGKFWRDIHHPRSQRAPYFSTLLLTGTPRAAAGGAPSAAEVYAAAVPYLQSVGHTERELLLQGLGPAAISAAVRQTRVLQDLNVTADALLRVVSVVVPRLVTLPSAGTFLLPVIDAARHQAGCSNTLELTDCSSLNSKIGADGSSSSSQDSIINTTKWCVALRAGAALRAGGEVCIPKT